MRQPIVALGLDNLSGMPVIVQPQIALLSYGRGGTGVCSGFTAKGQCEPCIPGFYQLPDHQWEIEVMQCTTHPETAAAGTCSYSGKPFCSNCLVEIKGKYYGKPFLDSAIDEIKDNAKSGNSQVFMNAGGGASSAANAQQQQPVTPTPIAVAAKSTSTAWLLWCFCFVGVNGLHRFYVGQPIRGTIYLLTFGLVGFGQLIDMFKIKGMVMRYNLANLPVGVTFVS